MECKYYVLIPDTQGGSFQDVLFLLLALILSELHEKPRRNKDSVTEKSIWKNLCEGHHFFGCIPSFLCHLFLSSSTLFLFPGDVRVECPLKRYIIILRMVFCVMISRVKSQKFDNLLQFNTNWSKSLETWHYFRICFNFSCCGKLF